MGRDSFYVLLSSYLVVSASVSRGDLRHSFRLAYHFDFALMPYTDLDSSAYSDQPPSAQENTEARSGRPSHPPRQASYSKRHASFDTPREVPFPSQSQPFVQQTVPLNPGRTSISRTSSGSTVTSIAGQKLSPTFTQSALPNASSQSQQDHGTLATTSGQKSADVGSHPPPTSTEDGSSAFTDGMTYSRSPEATSSSVTRSPSGPSLSYSQDSAGWDSEHLRPELLSLPRRKSRDLVAQATWDETAKGNNSPYMNDTRRDGESHDPSASSSTSSLPLPSHTPIGLLLTSGPSHQGTRLARVVEQVQSEFTAAGESIRSGSDSDSPFSNPPASPDEFTTHRRHSSPRINDPVSLFESTDRLSRGYARLSTSTTESTATTSTSVSNSSRSSTASSYISPPTPPQVHTPPTQLSISGYIQREGQYNTREENRKSAPYEPFLSHAPPPADAHIDVETTDQEYRLIVRLPGYKRDAMFVFHDNIQWHVKLICTTLACSQRAVDVFYILRRINGKRTEVCSFSCFLSNY